MRLSEDMKRIVLEQRLGFAASVCPDGTPNLSPKGTTTVLDDESLLFAHIRSPGTVRNLERNPAIELNVVDPVVRKGYRFKGRATLHSEGATYERALRVLAERGYDASPERITTIVVVDVDSAAPLISPAYDAGASEDDVAAVWERRLAELRGRASPPEEGPNAAELVRRFHELQGAFYGGGPIEPLVELLAADVRWHVPGRSAIAGDYAGRDEVLAYFKRRRELARARFRLAVREVVSAGELVFQLVGGTVERDGQTRSWETVGVLRIREGRISECWLLPFNQYLFDEIWS